MKKFSLFYKRNPVILYLPRTRRVDWVGATFSRAAIFFDPAGIVAQDTLFNLLLDLRSRKKYEKK